MKSRFQLADAKKRLCAIKSIAQVAAGLGTFDIKGPYKGQTHNVHVRFKSSELYAANELADFFVTACTRHGIDCVQQEHVVMIDPKTVDIRCLAERWVSDGS